MPLLRDIAPYSQDVGWLIGLIQDNDADGWLRTKDAIGGFYEEEGREGDDLIPQDHEVAFSYLNQLPYDNKLFRQHTNYGISHDISYQIVKDL